MRPVKTYLTPKYGTLRGKRVSNIKTFVARCLAPADDYSDQSTRERWADAMKVLNQTLGAETCVFCGEAADEWDHLNPILVNDKPTGYGHTIGNLVPACSACNKSKKNRNWNLFMDGNTALGAVDRLDRLNAYVDKFPSTPVDVSAAWVQLEPHLERIFTAFDETDRCIAELRCSAK